MRMLSGGSMMKAMAGAALVWCSLSASFAHAGAPPSVTLDGVAVCDTDTQQQVITWTLANSTTGGIEIQGPGVVDGSALTAGSITDPGAVFSPAIVTSFSSATATSSASMDAVGTVSISLSGIQGDIDSFRTYEGSVTLAGCVESTTTLEATTTSIAVEAPTTTAAVLPIALPSTGAHGGTAVLAALCMGMGVSLMAVRRRRVRS